jgi:hypothetical protein
LEAYKTICEKRIQDLCPAHQLPVLPSHLGNPAGAATEQANQTTVELRKSLALKEQDLTYAKQRNEKLVNEMETIKKSGGGDVQEALRKEIQLNEELQKKIQDISTTSQDDTVKALEVSLKKVEAERETLLDYIEQNMGDAQDKKGDSQLLFERDEFKVKFQDLERQMAEMKQAHEQKVNELMVQINNLDEDLRETQGQLNSKCGDYASLIKQIDPNF